MDQLVPLSKLENLIQLDLSDCPIAEKDNYRSEVFSKFPNLKILDNKDATGNEFEYSESDEDCQEIDEDEEDIEDVDEDSEDNDEDGDEDDEGDDDEDDDGEGDEDEEGDEGDEEEEGKPSKKVKE